MYKDSELKSILAQMPQDIIGKELKYKELCEQIGVESKTGNSKDSQLKDLALICDYTILQNPTRYRIDKIFDTTELPIHANNKYQLPAEYLVSKALAKNDYKDLYCTNTQLLMLLSVVNPNYAIIKDPKKRKRLGRQYEDMYKYVVQTGTVLKKWIDRILRRMQLRGIIMYRHGFCLCKDQSGVITIENVPMQSQREMDIMYCWHDAVVALGLGNMKNDFIPREIRPMFYKEFNRRIEEKFGSPYIGAYRVNVITGERRSIQKYIQDAEATMNLASQDRIATTVELNDMTGNQRQQLIDEIIKLPPEINYKQILLEG